jgi:hypothetical protein
MSIKVNVANVANKLYDKEKDIRDKHVNKITAFKKAMRALKGHVSLGEPDEGAGDRIGNELSASIRKSRKQIKAYSNLSKYNRVIKVSSDKKWLFVDEFECPDSGRTLYGSLDDYEMIDDSPVRFKGKLEAFKLDENYDLRKDLPIKAQLAEAKQKAIELIKQKRAVRKQIPFTVKKFAVKGTPYSADYNVYAGGGTGGGNGPSTKYFIHMQKGEILRLAEATKLRKVFEPKVPKTKLHHVGIEIEFISKSDKFQLASLLAKNNVADYVELKDDGSLRSETDYPHKHELCVLAPEVAIHEILRLVTKALDEAGSKVNGRCGLHVHIDVRNRDRTVVFNNFVRSQNILYAMNPRSRLDGTKSDGKRDEAYSRRVEYADFDAAIENIGGTKYWGVNPLTYSRLKTIEIRLHSGSTNFTKISNWIKILTNIANDSNKYKKDVDTAEQFCDRLHLNDEMLAYIKERIAKFKDTSGKHVTVDEAA